MKSQIGNHQTRYATLCEMNSHIQQPIDSNTLAIEIT